jgi:hypothetical protein
MGKQIVDRNGTALLFCVHCLASNGYPQGLGDWSEQQARIEQQAVTIMDGNAVCARHWKSTKKVGN